METIGNLVLWFFVTVLFLKLAFKVTGIGKKLGWLAEKGVEAFLRRLLK